MGTLLLCLSESNSFVPIIFVVDLRIITLGELTIVVSPEVELLFLSLETGTLTKAVSTSATSVETLSGEISRSWVMILSFES